MKDQIKLLIVEDNDDDALLEINELDSEGVDVVFKRVETIEDFVIALNNSIWDLIISDYNLVGFNGIQVLEAFKKTGIEIPFIIVSGTIGEENAVAAMKAGANDYVMKDHLSKLAPVVKRELLDASNRRERKMAEEKLEYERYLFTMLMDNIPDHIYFKDKESRFIRLNKAMLRRSGFNDLTDAIGKTDFDVFNDEHAQKAFQDEQTIIRTGEPIIDCEEKETWPDESVTWFSTTKVPLRDNAGQIIGTFGVSRDITENKLAQEGIRESEERFRMVFENVFDGISIYDEDPDPLKRKLIDCNEQYALMSGRTHDELLRIGNTKAFQVTIGEFQDNPRLESLTAKKEFSGSFFWMRPDGKKNVIEYTGVPIMWRGKRYTIGIDRDITERVQAEKQIKTLGKAIEQGPTSIVIANSKREIIFTNNKFTTLTQYLPEDVMGRLPRIFNPGHLPDDMFNDLWETLEKGNTWKGELLNRRKDKSLFWEKVSISALMNPDGTIGNYILIMDDITEKKQMLDDLIKAKEKAEESNRLKTAFLATMNHELRTPLNHILGFSELITSGVDPEENISFASHIQSSGQSLLAIIEGVFDLAMVEQANITLRNQTFSLIDHFMENKASFDNMLIASGRNEQVQLIFKPDTRWLSNYVTADRSKINQVLTNLFKNAIKFTPKGTIEFGFKVENGSYLTYYVKDSGIGIPAEKQSIIFDLFRQVDDSFTRIYGGIGVGLAISQKIANILNGELKVISTIDIGSTFSLTIPVEISDRRVVKELSRLEG